MNLQHFSSHVPDSVSEALVEFEKDFSYPLGASCRFRISHGGDYLRFFRSMGEATLLVAGDDGRVAGSIARVKRCLLLKRESAAPVETGVAHYLCDLKVRAEARGSMVLPRLIRETKRRIEESDTRCCYSVVMDGTGRQPTDYTGRLGVPKFERLAGITILRLSARGSGEQSMEFRVVDLSEFNGIAGNIRQSGCRATGGDGRLRSLMEPIHLVAGSGDACGILEDTRRAKRLFIDSGEELLSAHFSGFRYQTPEAGGMLLRDAVFLARAAGIPAVFTAVPSEECPRLLPSLAELDATEAPATIFGNDIESGLDWWIDTAEI